MYVNEIAFYRAVARTEVLPFTVEMNELDAAAADNAIVSADRYVYGDDSAKVDIKAGASVSGNQITIPRLFLTGEALKDITMGTYRVEIKGKNQAGTIQPVMNIVFHVVA